MFILPTTLPPDERKAVERILQPGRPASILGDRDLFPNWVVAWWGDTERLVWCRSGGGVWLSLDEHQNVREFRIVEGDEARELMIEYGYTMYRDDSLRIERHVLRGEPREKAMKFFPVKRTHLTEPTSPEGHQNHYYLLIQGAILVIEVDPDDRIVGHRILERQQVVDYWNSRQPTAPTGHA